jgi:hypothetical protein
LLLSEAYKVLDLKPQALMQEKYRSLRRHMFSFRMSADINDLVGVYPTLIGRPGYIRVDRPQATFPLLRFLKNCGVTPLPLLVRIQADSKCPERETELASAIQDAFVAIWNSKPEFDVVDFSHPSRPSAYLLWPSSMGQRSPHGIEITGLECVLLCACALRAIASAKEVDHAN